MKASHEFLFWYRLLAVGTMAVAYLAWCLIRKPNLLKTIADCEHHFWSRLVSPAFADNLKRLSEKIRLEIITKVMIVTTTVFSLAAFIYFSIWLIRHR